LRSAACSLALVIAALSACSHKPLDTDMIERFHAHKAEFQALANEALADIRHVREDRYRKSLADLGITEVSFVPHLPGTLAFRTNETAEQGSRLDFVYARSEPSPVVDSLDASSVTPHGYAYRRIDDHWYLRLTRE
jgi:hypothetical protein